MILALEFGRCFSSLFQGRLDGLFSNNYTGWRIVENINLNPEKCSEAAKKLLQHGLWSLATFESNLRAFQTGKELWKVAPQFNSGKQWKS